MLVNGYNLMSSIVKDLKANYEPRENWVTENDLNAINHLKTLYKDEGEGSIQARY